jgi:hypothetical protein
MPLYIRALPKTRSLFARALIAFGASALTHPVVWFIIPRFWLGHSFVAMIVASEVFAVVVEAAWLARFGVARALAWSVGANAASVIAGLAVRGIFGWP